MALQQRIQLPDIGYFQRSEGSEKRLGSLRVRRRCQQVHPQDEVVPGIKPMLLRIDNLGVFLGERRLQNLLVRAGVKPRVPSSNLLQRRWTGRLPRPQKTASSIVDPLHVRD